MSYKSSIKNWEGLARRDAFWSILTDNTKRGGKWKKEGFYESGRREVESIFRLLHHKNIEPVDRELAVDFGCGAGRISRALTHEFEKVIGIDASPTMVDIALESNKDYEDQLEFKLNQQDHLQLIPSESCSLIITLITLQHIPYPQSRNFISEFIRMLKPGGLLVFQIPTEDVRELSLIQRIKSFIRIRERLALIGLGKGFQMAMYTVDEKEIAAAVKKGGAKILLAINTNHTDPDFNGKLEFLKEGESASGYISKLFIIKKK